MTILRYEPYTNGTMMDYGCRECDDGRYVKYDDAIRIGKEALKYYKLFILANKAKRQCRKKLKLPSREKIMKALGKGMYDCEVNSWDFYNKLKCFME